MREKQYQWNLTELPGRSAPNVSKPYPDSFSISCLPFTFHYFFPRVRKEGLAKLEENNDDNHEMTVFCKNLPVDILIIYVIKLLFFITCEIFLQNFTGTKERVPPLFSFFFLEVIL